MTDQRDEEIAELRRRLEAVEKPEGAKPPPTRKKGAGSVIIVVIGLLLLMGYCTRQGGSGSFTANAWLPPEGFMKYDAGRGRSIGVQWAEPTAAECRGSGMTCFAVNVVTEEDCPRNLYMSVTLLGTGGDNIGWTNDTAQGVQAGETVRLVFDTYERNVQSARVADVSCY